MASNGENGRMCFPGVSMPARRSHVRRAETVITPQAVALFKKGLSLDPDSEEFVETSWALWRELKLKLWQLPPLWFEPDQGPDDPGHYQPDMIALRRELEAAVKEAELGSADRMNSGIGHED